MRGDTGTFLKQENQKREISFYQCKIYVREEREKTNEKITSGPNATVLTTITTTTRWRKSGFFLRVKQRLYTPPPPTLAVLTDVSLSWSVLIQSNLLQNGLFYQPPALASRWIIFQTKERRKKTQDNKRTQNQSWRRNSKN